MGFFGEFSWPDFISLFPTYIGAITGAVLLYITMKQIIGARKEADRRAAFSFFNSELENPDFLELRRKVSEIKNKYKDPKVLLDGKRNDDFVAAVSYLDKRELLSIGILNGGLSEEYSKSIVGRSFLTDWVYFSDFINAIRMTHEDNGLYKNIETLASKWSHLKVGRVR